MLVSRRLTTSRRSCTENAFYLRRLILLLSIPPKCMACYDASASVSARAETDEKSRFECLAVWKAASAPARRKRGNVKKLGEGYGQRDQIGQFIHVWATFKSLNCSRFRINLKRCQTLSFSGKENFGQLFYTHWATLIIHWATFYTHCATFYSHWATFYAHWATFYSSHQATLVRATSERGLHLTFYLKKVCLLITRSHSQPV